MQGVHLRKYGVETTIDFEVYEVDGVDLRVDWVPAAADCEVMKDEGASTQCTNTATDEGSTYSIVLTATEMEAARLIFKAVDAATKVFLDKVIIIETYGDVLAMHESDLDTPIEDQVWDAILTGASHNSATSAGRRLRQLSSNVYTDGTAQAGGVNQITLAAGESSQNDIYQQSYVAIIGGTGAGQGHHILTYNGTSKIATIDDDWIVQPDATSEYIIYGAGSHDGYEEGLAQAGANGSITLQSTAETGTNRYKDSYITILSGVGAHQSRRITGYNGSSKVATVSPDWVVNPDSTSGYNITPQANAIETAKEVWDRIISKANHNVGQSAGKNLRELGVLIAAEGAVSGTPTTTVFTTNITGFDDNFFVDQVVSAYNGADQAGQGRIIVAYDGTTGVITIDEPFTTALNSGDDVVIFTLHVHPVGQIADAVLDELTSEHTIAGSVGKVLNDQARSAATIRNGAVVSGTLSTTEMTTDLTVSIADQFNGRIIIFASDTTTAALRGQATDITATTVSGSKLGFTALTTAPVVGDTFAVV